MSAGFAPIARLEWVDDAKGLSILAIVIYHACIIIGTVIPHGDMGVDVFVLLSGFGLAFSRRDETLAAYFRRRLLNIGPRYWVCLIIFVILFQMLGIAYTTIPQFIAQAAFGNLFVNTIAGAWWFLSMIAALYAAYAFILPVVRQGDVGAVIAIGLGLELVFVYFLGLIVGTSGNGTPNNTLGIYAYVGYRIISFFFGIALAIVIQKRVTFTPISLALAAVLGLIWFFRATSIDVGLLLYPAGGIVLLAVFIGGSIGMRRINRPAALTLSFLGTYSYEIYLIHHPLMQYINRWAWNSRGIVNPTHLEIISGTIAGFVVTLVSAVWLSRVDLLAQRIRNRRVPAARYEPHIGGADSGVEERPIF